MIFFGASLSGGAAARAATGTLGLSWGTAGAVQNSAVRLIAVNRRGGASGAASVLCTTVNGTAIAGKDFTALNSKVTWANGDAADKWCNVTVSNATPFTGQKTFYVKLSNPTGAPLGNSTTAVTIYGDKGAGLVSLSAATYTAAQSGGSVKITVNRTGGSSGGASVSYATANNTAIAGTNYTSERGGLSWGNGDAAPKSFVIPISNAVPFSGTKKLAVAIASAEGASLGTTASAIVTINGNSTTAAPSVSLSASPTSVTSGNSATVIWSAANATACTASGAWTGAMATSGSKATGAITAAKTYTLACTGAGGTATQSATVAVNAAPPPVIAPTGLSCTGTNGPLTLRASAVRDTGISPFLVFFDATGTTDTSIGANRTAFQDVTYSWNFGDTGASGTDTWAYGSNKGHNSRNTATGGVAAHLYVTPGVDTAYVVTVTAHNGANTASCQLGVTAHDPAGANGFAGAKTTCVSASGTPVPGSGGCPAGAAALSTSSFNTALGSLGSGKRVLFKCGDKFTGDNATLNGTTWSVGAYGGCEGTQTNQPIFNDSAGTGNYQLDISPTAGDGRISDIYFNGNGSAGGAVAMAAGPTQTIPYQITLWNLQSSGNAAGYYWAQGAQWGLIGSTQLNSRGS
ncbi:MAG TPA: Calx-beta domain-containing protein, partial [Steroidobacteraceae bacterium]